MTKQTRDMAASMSVAEGDRICGLVLQLVNDVVFAHPAPRPTRRAPEPTGAAYAPEMASFVEQRSDQRRR